jgi:hypothetical protein
MKHIKTFIESINEGKIDIGKMNFSVRVVADNKGLAINFLPDSKTLKFSKNEQVEALAAELKKKVPFFGDIVFYEINNGAVDLSFRVDIYGLSDKIEKALK